MLLRHLIGEVFITLQKVRHRMGPTLIMYHPLRHDLGIVCHSGVNASLIFDDTKILVLLGGPLLIGASIFCLLLGQSTGRHIAFVIQHGRAQRFVECALVDSIPIIGQRLGTKILFGCFLSSFSLGWLGAYIW